MQREMLNCDAVAAKASANATDVGECQALCFAGIRQASRRGSVIVPRLQVQRLRLGEVIQLAHCEELGLRPSLAASQNPGLTSAL